MSVCPPPWFSGVFQSLYGHRHGSRGAQTCPPLRLKKPVLSGRTATGLFKILCHRLQVSPKDITLLCLVFQMHPWFFSLLIFLLPFLISHSCSQLLLPLQSSISPFLPLSCILFSGFMCLDERQKQVGPLALHSTNMTYQDHCVLQYVCYCAMPQQQCWTKANQTNMHWFYILHYQTLKTVILSEWFYLFCLWSYSWQKILKNLHGTS